jgi:hypothetical protein
MDLHSIRASLATLDCIVNVARVSHYAADLLWKWYCDRQMGRCPAWFRLGNNVNAVINWRLSPQGAEYWRTIHDVNEHYPSTTERAVRRLAFVETLEQQRVSMEGMNSNQVAPGSSRTGPSPYVGFEGTRRRATHPTFNREGRVTVDEPPSFDVPEDDFREESD